MGVFGTTDSPILEVIAAYVAGQQSVSAADPLAWSVVGAFFLPLDAAGARLELIGLVTSGSLEMRARLWDLTAAAEVSGSVTPPISATADARALSGLFSLTGGRLYQFQVSVLGGSGSGTARSAQLMGAQQ